MSDFLSFYKDHCNEVLELIQARRLDYIESCIVVFYRHRLPEKFPNLIHEQLQEIIEPICQCDTSLYETIKVSMLSIMSCSPTNNELLAAVEEYTHQLENYLKKGLEGYPIKLFEKKVQVARAFVSKSWRHIRLIRLAESVATLIYRPDVLNALRTNWEGVDIAFAIDHASRLPREECCVADGKKIKRIMVDNIGDLLCGRVEFMLWITQMESVIEHYLSLLLPSLANDVRRFRFSAEQFMMNWTFYTTLILEELTLANVESIGMPI
ncbi:hypothetical protein BDB00DRAFT_786775 [Zychaea mexicana]|uniref:uncharacterized protein n=1 Tax=Zychaea mexicana TaxID=64656 RepID=UPI0022FE15E3|nr:uncharacterized protein BDB00DRAFT_786775 [Zychaea mexicana]KAI9494931.1 hypothetical protein BDB00DRAFT_786775 [Zychaea mexicana]